MKIFLLLCLLLSGCVTRVQLPDPRVKFISQKAVSPSLFTAFDAYYSTGSRNFAPDRPTDNIYFFPSHLQLHEMDLAVRPKLHRTYLAEAWDCDDMAWEWRVLCHRWAVENVSKELPIAVFVCYAEVDENAFDGRLGFAGHHALGLLADANGVWWYIEPKLGYRVKCQEAKLEDSIRCYKIVW